MRQDEAKMEIKTQEGKYENGIDKSLIPTVTRKEGV